jgi:hypothetical protein
VAATPWSRVLEKFEQNLVPYAVAVAYERTLADSDQDGTTWAMLASDGEDSETLTVCLPTSERAKLTRLIDTEDVEHAVEHRAGAYAGETRLSDLAKHGDVVLTADELNKFT